MFPGGAANFEAAFVRLTQCSTRPCFEFAIHSDLLAGTSNSRAAPAQCFRPGIIDPMSYSNVYFMQLTYNSALQSFEARFMHRLPNSHKVCFTVPTCRNVMKLPYARALLGTYFADNQNFSFLGTFEQNAATGKRTYVEESPS